MAPLGVTVFAGAAAMVLAWYQASDTVVVEDQVRWASVGLSGAMLVALAGFVAVAVAHRRMRLRFRVVEAQLRPCLTAMADASALSAPIDADALVATPNMRHYHRAGCPLASGKPVRFASRADHERAGRRTCAVCAP